MRRVTVGIRREDKNAWERRVPLIPADLAALRKEHDIRFIVQPSPIRIYPDDDYRAAGIELSEDLGEAGIVLAVKEIPAGLMLPKKVYVCFSHVIKGQPRSMPMLRRLMELGCSLVDYEKIVDEAGRRLIFFGIHAGCAGMIETLWCLGRRLKTEGVETPLSEVRHAYEYDGLEHAKTCLRSIGEDIRRNGAGLKLPLVFGLAGYGNVSRGCQDILDCLPVLEIAPAALPAAARRPGDDAPPLIKVVFKEEHMVRPRASSGRFDLQDYYRNPERYVGDFERHLPHLDVLVNTIYWEERYPRLVTRSWAKDSYGPKRRPRLKVIGDISCDIAGSVELTLKATEPDSPCYVYDPAADAAVDGWRGPGPVVMAVDNLPCELPRESSRHFSASLRGMIAALAAADWRADFGRLDLPAHLKNAVIVHTGGLTSSYRYLQRHLGPGRPSSAAG